MEHPLIVDSYLRGPATFAGAAILSGVQTAEALHIGPDVVLDQMPVANGCYVTRAFGLRDHPKRPWDAPGATLMNRPWAERLAATGIAADWRGPHAGPGERTLWTARLYPAVSDREESLRLALPLHDPAAAYPGWLAAWQAAPVFPSPRARPRPTALGCWQSCPHWRTPSQPGASALRWRRKNPPGKPGGCSAMCRRPVARRNRLAAAWVAQLPPSWSCAGSRLWLRLPASAAGKIGPSARGRDDRAGHVGAAWGRGEGSRSKSLPGPSPFEGSRS